MGYRPGDAYHKLFPTANPATFGLYRNNVPDPAIAMTVTYPATGLSGVSFTIPATYAGGDDLELIADTTVGGVEGLVSVEKFRVEVDYDGKVASVAGGVVSLDMTTDVKGGTIMMIDGPADRTSRVIADQTGAEIIPDRAWDPLPAVGNKFVLGIPSLAASSQIAFDGGTVETAPNASTFTSSSPTLTSTKSDSYEGSNVIFQATSGLGRVHRVVKTHTISGGVHTFVTTTTTGTTPVVGPAPGDTFRFG